jgi:hypothetical protein
MKKINKEDISKFNKNKKITFPIFETMRIISPIKREGKKFYKK